MSQPTSQKAHSTFIKPVPRVFVGGIPRIIKQDELLSYFEQFGGVETVDLPINRRKGILKGFAFVTFKDQVSMQSALSQKEHVIKGKKVALREALDFAQASKETRRLQSAKLFVKGFSLQTTEREIEDLFSIYGEVNRVLYSVSAKTGCFRGFCYVIMKECVVSESLIKKAKIRYQGRVLHISAAQSLKDIKVQRQQLSSKIGSSTQETINGSANCNKVPSVDSFEKKSRKKPSQRKSQVISLVEDPSQCQGVDRHPEHSRNSIQLINRRRPLESRNTMETEPHIYHQARYQSGSILFKPDINFQDQDFRTIVQKLCKSSESKSDRHINAYRLNIKPAFQQNPYFYYYQ